MAHPAQALAPGFPNPVLDSQACFRAIMQAMARPGTLATLPPAPHAPAEFGPIMGAVALTLLDFETSVWCDSADPLLADWLRFHTGSRRTPQTANAAFAFVVDGGRMPTLGDFAIGTEDYPDRSTTLVLKVDGFSHGRTFTIRGPGLAGTATMTVAGLPKTLPEQWQANRALFPRGVDILLAGPDGIVGWPRTLRVEEI